MRTPTLHRANIAHKECGWKDGDRGGLAESKQTKTKKKAKVCLDSDRPSHGRTWPVDLSLSWIVSELPTIRPKSDQSLPNQGSACLS
jgi:hypothetical protein